MTYLVVYDIVDNGTRARLARYLEHNGVRLQKSVFAVDIQKRAFKKFLVKIHSITGGAGEVAVFRLCNGCRDRALNLSEAEERLYYVF